MIQSNKILTVSYGTFSCTLEGFDDSFGTMKAIAEYFRDLASDDRYFGAEPPVPDTEMMARIAQREISRKVEARTESGRGIVLRARDLEPLAPAAADASAPIEHAPVRAEVHLGPPAPAGLANGSDAPEPPQATECLAGPCATIPTAVASRQSTDAPEPDELAPEPSETAPVEPRTAQPNSSDQGSVDQTWPEPESDLEAAQAPEPELWDIPEADDLIARDADTPLSTPEMNAEAAEEGSAALAMAGATEETPVDRDNPPALGHRPRGLRFGDSIANKLQRIRDVVSRNEIAARDGAEVTEDEPADAFVDKVTEKMTKALEADSNIGAGLEAAGSATEPSYPEVDSEMLSTCEFSEAPEAAALSEDSDSDAPVPAPGDATPEETGTDDEDELMRSVLASAAPPAVSDTADQDTIPGEPDKGPDAEAQAADPQPDIAPDPAPSDPQAIEATDAELDAAPAEIDIEDTGADSAAPQEPAPQPVAEDEAELTRLMEATEEKMCHEETRAAHDTIEQERAAADATRADTRAPRAQKPDVDDALFRRDLERIIRPKRPVASDSRKERESKNARPAPLKLIAEQRIDTAVQHGPVQPRRVAVEDAVDTGTADGSFATFASEMGANALPELFEAAAAYISFVEGRAQFSRPQLMNKVRQIDAARFNREDGLRSFGLLLRQGKIEKTGGGRFAASGEIRFRPDERAAG